MISNIGALYRVLWNQHEEAEENLTRALKQNEKSFIALCNLANVLQLNQNDEAIEFSMHSSITFSLLLLLEQFSWCVSNDLINLNNLKNYFLK